MPKMLDLSGQRFGKLVAIEPNGKTKANKVLWRCQCDCGNETLSVSSNLTSLRSTSCGCVGRKKASERMARISLKHGHAKRGKHSSEYRSFMSMHGRCKYDCVNSFEHYGGRGIQVCDRWSSFENFLVDMGPKPSPRHSIDRINPDRGYEPGNCRWATAREQRQNRRGYAGPAEIGWLLRPQHQENLGD